MFLLFNILFRFVIAFHPRSKCLLISWLQPPSTVILEPKKIKSDSISTFPILFAKKMWLDAMILVLFFSFPMIRFNPAFDSLSPSSRGSFIGIICVSELLIFLPAIFIPACALSSSAFHMMCSEYKLNKQGDNIQPCHTPSQFGTRQWFHVQF